MRQLQSKFKIITFLLIISLFFTNCSKKDEVKNQKPKSFDLIEVADGATEIGLTPQLTWEAAIDPDGDKVSYQVYLDTQDAPQTSVANDLGANTFTLKESLLPGTTYYWMVIANDGNGNATRSKVSSFTTKNRDYAQEILGKWFVDGERLSICKSQEYWLFKFNSVLVIQEFERGSTKGNCEESPVVGARFSFAGGNKMEIKLTNIKAGKTYTIKTLTDTKLVLVSGKETLKFKR